jgi:hypothetical protein
VRVDVAPMTDERAVDVAPMTAERVVDVMILRRVTTRRRYGPSTTGAAGPYRTGASAVAAADADGAAVASAFPAGLAKESKVTTDVTKARGPKRSRRSRGVGAAA